MMRRRWFDVLSRPVLGATALIPLLALVAQPVAASASTAALRRSVGVVTEYPIPTLGTAPYGITSSGGELWFTETRNGVGRADTSGQITEYSKHIPPPAYPEGIAAGSDGNVWFTEKEGGAIARITPQGRVTTFPLPTGTFRPFPIGITAGPDGALWYTEYYRASIGRITTSGAITEFPVAGATNPLSITAGQDGALWFTAQGANAIGRIDTLGQATLYPIPTPNAGAFGITAGPDGALWFTESRTGKIGRITVDGQITEYRGKGTSTLFIAAGADGALWVTENSLLSIERFTTGGRVHVFALPSGRSPIGITLGPDGNLWFVEQGANGHDQVARITDGR
ncbi:MAG TPA: Virginiamycin B lyase [Actinomycetota bacterium]|nr:Virginiamycin B lyase [Actinomycetota bacterium]